MGFARRGIRLVLGNATQNANMWDLVQTLNDVLVCPWDCAWKINVYYICLLCFDNFLRIWWKENENEQGASKYNTRIHIYLMDKSKHDHLM